MKERDASDWARVSAMTEDEIVGNAREDPDNPPTEAAFWADAVLVPPTPKKVAVSIRLKQDVLDFFKNAGPGYQTRINDVLEAYVRHQRKLAKGGSNPANRQGSDGLRAAR